MRNKVEEEREWDGEKNGGKVEEESKELKECMEQEMGEEGKELKNSERNVQEEG